MNMDIDINALVSRITEEVLKKVGDVGSGKPGDVNVLRMIDHTLLKPDATRDEVKKICDEAKQYGFASVCVNPSYVGFVARELAGSGVAPCCVIGFPLGATPPEVKAYETDVAINAGAKEVDMVINIGAAKSGDWDLVQRDIEAVVRASRKRALVKVIIETCLLTDAEKVAACKAAVAAGADFVKTSTGFSKHGATVPDVKLMRETVGPHIGVKASGGVRDLNSALAMINAGANRLGTSSGVTIAKELQGAPETTTTHTCVGCGHCSSVCPVGAVEIIKRDY
jgi:deoxyribose-phosphate aldolase